MGVLRPGPHHGPQIAVVALLLACAPRAGPLSHHLTGTVHDGGGAPLAGAVVRVQATSHSGVTGPDGAFSLDVSPLGPGPHAVTAWAPGHYVRRVDGIRAGPPGSTLVLDALPAGDDAGYAWLPSLHLGGEGTQEACEGCHSQVGTDLPHPLPVDQWRQDAHSRGASNALFLTMYEGSDAHGRQGPVTRWAQSRDYGTFPLPPDPREPWYGPGYRLDHPDTPGACAACHAPAAAVGAPTGTDPRGLTGAEAEGVGCDFCHKVVEVLLDPDTGLPHPGRPGVLSVELRRPSPDRQLFLGPLDDAAGDDAYAEVFESSRFCAPCHHGVFWGTLVYGSYAEWASSPWSDPERGATCQDCHMPPSGTTRFAHPDGLERAPDTLAGHRMPGARDATFIADSLGLEVEAERAGGRVAVRVEIRNEGVGHHVPTGSPMRQLIALVAARDAMGVPLARVSGPVLPGWVGVGDPGEGRYAGLPGEVYAKVLEEMWSGESPTAAYWNPCRVVEDDRIPALGAAVESWEFAAPEAGEVGVEVTLLYRTVLVDLAEVKGWEEEDLPLVSRTLWLDQGETSSR